MALVAPSNLNASATTTNNINLSWTNNDTYTSIFIQRKVSGGSYSALTTKSGSATSHSDSTAEDGIKYYYKLRGWDAGEGFSDFCTEAYATTALKVPTSLAGHAESDTSVHLTWSDNTSNETGYEVYRGSTKVTTTAASVETYTNTGLTKGTTYTFKVRAVNAVTNSAYSSTVSVLCLTTPTSPNNLALTVLGPTSIKLDWNDRSSNEDTFKIYRSADGSSYDYIGYVNQNIETYTDTGLTASTLYYYKVRAHNDAGYSSYCTAVSATTSSGVTLAAPTGFTAVPLTGTKVELGFTNNSVGETYHSIERAGAEIKQLGAGSTTYTDSGLTAGTAYSYKVRDYEGGAYGDYCTSAVATPPKEFGYIAWGGGSTAASVGLTALVSEVDRSAASVELATTYTTDDTVRFSYEFTATTSAVVKEIGVFTASSAGTMLGRNVLASPLTVAEGTMFRVQHDVAVKDGGCGG